MASPAASGHDRGMNSNASIAASASRLRRSAGELRNWAGSPGCEGSKPSRHLGSRRGRTRPDRRKHAAHGALGRKRAPRTRRQRGGGEARALDYQLRTIATSLIEARDACPAACERARRLVAESVADRPQSAAASTIPTGPRRIGGSDLVRRPRRRAASTATTSRAPHSRRPWSEPARATPGSAATRQLRAGRSAIVARAASDSCAHRAEVTRARVPG